MGNNLRITGHDNPAGRQWVQLTSADGLKTYSFYQFRPVGGDATLAYLFDKMANADISGGLTYYQNIPYTGSFNAIQVTSGTVLLYLSKT